jgi:hypothetical protein
LPQAQRVAPKAGPAAVGAFLIVNDNVIDGDTTLGEFFTLRAAEKSQSRAWKATFDFRKQRQRKNGIAEITRLQDQDVFPPGGRHDL